MSTLSTQTNGRKLSIGIDLGTGFAAADIFEGSRFQAIESPLDGSQIEMVVYHDPESNKFHIGKEAYLRSFDDDGDNVFMHVKRNVPKRPDEVVYGDRFTPIEILTQILQLLRKLLVAARPELADYPQFGGNKRSADELAIIFTVPANWSIEQQSHYEVGIHDAGFVDFDGFIAEPIAAARRLAHVNTVSLKDGDRILVVDVGAGTTDIAALEYRRGVFHQVSAASGDGYLAGLDFTNALAQEIATANQVGWDGIYSEGGISLSDAAMDERQAVLGCWRAAEEAKKHLSVMDEATVTVELSEGRKTFSITLEQAHELWSGLIDRFKDSIRKSLRDCNLDFSVIEHPMLVGGTSRIPLLRTAMGEVMEKEPSEILVCTDSERIVSSGAAEHGFYQDEASQALEGGLGLTVFDPEESRHRNLLLIAPGQVLPADGFFFERSGFGIGVLNGSSTLVCNPFICRNGVRATVVQGRDTFLEETETIALEEVQAPLDDFPSGEHGLAVGVKVDATRKIRLLCRATDLSQVETISIPLVMEEGKHSPEKSFRTLDILLLLDCSKSMSKFGKLEMLRRGAQNFAKVALQNDASLGILAFPSDSKSTRNEGARLACDLCREQGRLSSAIESLTAGGGTPLHSAFDLALESFPARSESTGRFVVVFTDGMPSDPRKAERAADKLKAKARLITVGIGEDVVEPYLRSLATDPEDYFYADGAESIFDSFVGVTELLWRDSNEPDSADEDLELDTSAIV